jgi:hypothetical protein
VINLTKKEENRQIKKHLAKILLIAISFREQGKKVITDK